MRTLIKSSAEGTVNLYIRKIEEFRRCARDNFGDMDLENNDKWDEIEKIIGEIERQCNSAVGALEGLRFE